MYMVENFPLYCIYGDLGLPFPSPVDLPNQELNSNLLHCRQICYCLSHLGSPEYSVA